MKRLNKLLVFIVLVVFLISCSRVEASVSDVVCCLDTDSENAPVMGVWADAVVPDAEDLVMIVRNSNGNLAWTVHAQSSEYQGKTYYGYTGFVLPGNSSEDYGNWTVELCCKDGQVATGSFQLP